MASKVDDFVLAEGVIVEQIHGSWFFVSITSGEKEYKVRAYTAGKIKYFKVKIAVGDKVTIEIPISDKNNSRIVFRHK